MQPFSLFKRRIRGEEEHQTAALQIPRSHSVLFSALDRYTPLCRPEFRLFDSIREAVPMIDAALSKIVALTGGFEVITHDPVAQKPLEWFLENVPVGDSMTGIEAFTAQHLDQMLMYGTAVGEILPSGGRDTIAALYNAPLDCIEIGRDEKRGGVQVCTRIGGQAVPVRYPDLIVLSALNPRPGQVQGNSLLRSLPFVTQILMKIYNTIGVNFDRVGNVRFAVTYKPSSDSSDRAFAKDRAAQIAEQWSKAMRENSDGAVSDFVAVGDVQIKVIGADNQILDCEVPVRQMLEQMVARLGIPPFMLGLSWSSTERMSSQQADLLTSELWGYRRLITPTIRKICRTWLLLNGYDPGVSIEWDNISLQDEIELAKAELYRMQAAQIKQALLGKE